MSTSNTDIVSSPNHAAETASNHNAEPAPAPAFKKPTRLADLPVNTETDALNLMVNFLNHAQRQGCYTFDESAKIYECIKKFKSD